MTNDEKAAYEALEIAHAILEKHPCDPERINLLCVLAQCHTISMDSAPLFNDSVEATPWGPVIPTLFHHYKDHEGIIRQSDPIDQTEIDDADLGMIDWIIEEYDGKTVKEINDLLGSKMNDAFVGQLEPSKILTNEQLKGMVS